MILEGLIIISAICTLLMTIMFLAGVYVVINGWRRVGEEPAVEIEPAEIDTEFKLPFDSPLGYEREPVIFKVPVTDNRTTHRPPTKSQQRRINEKKGLGALTDDEVKAERNAKRRAARAAKASYAQVTHNPNTINELEPTLKEKIAAK